MCCLNAHGSGRLCRAPFAIHEHMCSACEWWGGTPSSGYYHVWHSCGGSPLQLLCAVQILCSSSSGEEECEGWQWYPELTLSPLSTCEEVAEMAGVWFQLWVGAQNPTWCLANILCCRPVFGMQVRITSSVSSKKSGTHFVALHTRVLP